MSNKVRHGSTVAPLKAASMNDMPIPAGSWQAHYNANQKRYNSHLLGGATFAAITLIVVSYLTLVLLELTQNT